MPSYSELPYETHMEAFQRARAAGDNTAASTIAEQLKKHPQFHSQAYGKARQAGDLEALNTIAKQYNQSFGEVTDDNISNHDIFMSHAAEHWKATQGDKPMPTSPAELAEYGLDVVRDKAHATTTQVADIARMATDDISREEGLATLGMQRVYDDMPVSLKGVWEFGKRLLNPMDSPDTYLGLGMGKLGTTIVKGLGKEAAKKSLVKYLTKKGLEHEAATQVAQDAAEKGFRTLSTRLATGAAAGAPTGALYAGMADAAKQAQEEAAGATAGYDPGRGAAAAATGAVAGGAIGSAVKALPLPGIGSRASNLAKGRAREFGDAYSKVGSPLALERLRTAANEVTGVDVGDEMAARLSDRTTISKVLDRAMKEPINNLRLMNQELKDLVNRGDIPHRVYMEAVDALTSAKSKGRSPGGFTPELAKTSPEVYSRLSQLVDAVNAESRVVDDITRQAGDIFEQPGLAEKILTDPSVNVMADMLPGGYVASRALGRITKESRIRKVGKEVVGRLKAGEDLAGKAERAGPRAAAMVERDAAEAAEMAGIGRRTADESDAARQAMLREKARVKQARTEANDPQRLARARAEAIRLGRGGPTRHGGPQAEVAVRQRIDKKEADRVLRDMANEAKAAGNPEEAAAIQRFRQDFGANLNTNRPWREPKDLSDARYYRIQEELKRRARPMSDEAYTGYLRNVENVDASSLGRLAARKRAALEREAAERATTAPPPAPMPTPRVPPPAPVTAQPVATPETMAAFGQPTPAVNTAKARRKVLEDTAQFSGDVTPNPADAQRQAGIEATASKVRAQLRQASRQQGTPAKRMTPTEINRRLAQLKQKSDLTLQEALEFAQLTKMLSQQ